MRVSPASPQVPVLDMSALKRWLVVHLARCETEISFRSPLIACVWRADWILSGMATSVSHQRQDRQSLLSAHHIPIWPPTSICPTIRAYGQLSRLSAVAPGAEPFMMLTVSFKRLMLAKKRWGGKDSKYNRR